MEEREVYSSGSVLSRHKYGTELGVGEISAKIGGRGPNLRQKRMEELRCGKSRCDGLMENEC